jgi:hypothetical protein
MPRAARAAVVGALCGAALAGCGSGDELVTIDRMGRADAPKSLTLQINAAYSPQAPVPEVADGFKLAWAEFVLPFILLTSPTHLPISVAILNLQGTYATNSTGILAAGSAIAVLPAVLLFVLLQRFIVGIFVQGAVKG